MVLGMLPWSWLVFSCKIIRPSSVEILEGIVPVSALLPILNLTTLSAVEQTTPVQEQTEITGTPKVQAHPRVSVPLLLSAATKSHIAECSGKTEGALVGIEVGSPDGTSDG